MGPWVSRGMIIARCSGYDLWVLRRENVKGDGVVSREVVLRDRMLPDLMVTLVRCSVHNRCLN